MILARHQQNDIIGFYGSYMREFIANALKQLPRSRYDLERRSYGTIKHHSLLSSIEKLTSCILVYAKSKCF
jgi:hypothetical protein